MMRGVSRQGVNTLHRVVVAGVISILISCSSYGSDSVPLSSCSFNIGDSVKRGPVGAVVPVRGESVNGFADTTSGSASIEIKTSDGGLVTISTTENGVKASPQV